MNKIASIFVYILTISFLSYTIPVLRVGYTGEGGSDYVQMFCVVTIIFLAFLKSSTTNVQKIPYVVKLSTYLIITSVVISSILSDEISEIGTIKLITFLIMTLSIMLLSSYKTCFNSIVIFVFVSVLLTAYGFYGYITGNVGTEASKFWWEYAKYWGIHYTQSTRNSDVYYPAIALCLIIPYVFTKTTKTIKFVVCLAVAFFLAAIILSLSRGAWLSLAVVLMAVIYFMSLNKYIGKNAIVCGMLIIAMVGVYTVKKYGQIDYLVSKVLSITSLATDESHVSSNRDRLAIASATIGIITENPFGVGYEGLRNHYKNYGLFINHAENTYLNAFAELGVIGFVGFVVIILKPLREFYARLRRSFRTYDLSMFLVCLYLAVSYLFNVEYYGVLFWFIYSLIWTNIMYGENNDRYNFESNKKSSTCRTSNQG